MHELMALEPLALPALPAKGHQLHWMQGSCASAEVIRPGLLSPGRRSQRLACVVLPSPQNPPVTCGP